MANEIFKPIRLSDESRQTLTEMGPNLEMLEKEIAKAKRAGLDIEDLEKRFEELKKLRIGLLREYS